MRRDGAAPQVVGALRYPWQRRDIAAMLQQRLPPHYPPKVSIASDVVSIALAGADGNTSDASPPVNITFNFGDTEERAKALALGGGNCSEPALFAYSKTPKGACVAACCEDGACGECQACE